MTGPSPETMPDGSGHAEPSGQCRETKQFEARGNGYLARIVDAAAFSDHDRDMGTSGLCGTFALAVKSAIGDVRLALLCPKGEDEFPLRAEDGSLQWRHAVVLHGGDIIDIDGRVLLQDIVNNYCWDAPPRAGGVLVEVGEDELLAILKSDRKSFDSGYLETWSRMLAAAASARTTTLVPPLR